MKSYIEHEVKLPVHDVSSTLSKIRSVAVYVKTQYVRDVIYGEGKRKLRLRISDDGNAALIEVEYKRRVLSNDDLKVEIEDTLYTGTSVDDALKKIHLEGDFVEENSYEKVRMLFVHSTHAKITVDVYPFGAWIEVEGERENILAIARSLGYSSADYILETADELYLAWIKKHNLPEMWDVRFGFNGKK